MFPLTAGECIRPEEDHCVSEHACDLHFDLHMEDAEG